jgi:hypothetical protein
MADAKITELTEVANLDGSDFFAIVNGGSTKKVSLSAIFNSFSVAYQPYLNAAVAPLNTIVTTNSDLWTNASTLTVASSADWSTHVVGTENVVVGPFSLENINTGYKNTSVGVKSLSANTTGSGNVGIGYQTLFLNVSGSGNTAVGFNAGYANVIGINNTYIGNQSTGNCPDESNAITLGNGSIKILRCQASTITSLSDIRDKTNITPLPVGLKFINSLTPVEFVWSTRDKQKVGVRDTGFIAQELISAQAKSKYIVPGLVNTANPEKLEASYGKLIPVLVKAIQELTDKVNELEKKLH